MPQRNQRVRVGITGAGWVATDRHLPAYLAHPDVDVVAIHDPHITRARRLGGLGEVPLATDRWDEFLEQRLDLVSVCTPPFKHAQQAVALLEADTHVFLEKPMAMDLESAQEIARVATSRDRSVCVSHNFLYSRSMQRLRRVLDSGAAGEIRSVMGVQASSPGRRLPSWYGQLPAGLFFDESPHLLYLVDSLLRSPRLLAATADAAPPGAEQPVRSLHALLTSETAPATLTMCFDAPVSEWYLVVVCERRVLTADLFRDISVVLGPDGGHGPTDILRTSASALAQHVAGFAGSGARHISGRQSWGHQTLIHQMVDAVRDGSPAPVPVADSLRVVAMTDAILGAVL